jgi:Tfp pilus assembly protein PilF
MRRAFTSSLAVVAILLVAIGCRSGGGDLTRAENQRLFGVRMARMNLWREAMFRFRRATEIDPANAMSHNNLAVALEANGDFDGAAREYREALRLDRSNQYIQKNYSRFVEFTQRAKKRDATAAKVTAAAAPATATAPGTTPAPEPAAPAAPPAPPATDTAPPPPPTSTNPPDGELR